MKKRQRWNEVKKGKNAKLQQRNNMHTHTHTSPTFESGNKNLRSLHFFTIDNGKNNAGPILITVSYREKEREREKA